MSADRIVTRAQWRTLYWELLRAAPRTVSGNRKQTQILVGIIRQGSGEMRRVIHAGEAAAAQYQRGCNTLGFLKLARELGSVERQVVASLLKTHAERALAERRTSRAPESVESLTYDGFDRAVAGLARDLDIVIPKYKPSVSLEWIPERQ
ncbi:hypothetical protein GGF46_001428 [Coemansia sp. RSA 552]|nr:hypothetical protein GGF46_001428 [Coemansia sp. RSA 552]